MTDGYGIVAPPTGPVLSNQLPSTFHPKWDTCGETCREHTGCLRFTLVCNKLYTDAVHNMGVQNAPLPNTSLLSEDYFELKATETLGVHKKLPYYPEELKLGLFPRKELVPAINVTKVAPYLCVRANICPACLLFLSSWEGHSIPGKPQAPTSTLSSDGT